MKLPYYAYSKLHRSYGIADGNRFLFPLYNLKRRGGRWKWTCDKLPDDIEPGFPTRKHHADLRNVLRKKMHSVLTQLKEVTDEVDEGAHRSD
jgi:hypothetical protein